MGIQKRKKRKNQFIYRYFLPILQLFLPEGGKRLKSALPLLSRVRNIERNFL